MAPMPGTMIHGILDRTIQFLQEPKNQKRIHHDCIDPLIRHILDRMFPYIILTCIIFSIILLMSISTVGLLIFQLRNGTIATGAGSLPQIIQAAV